MTEDSLSDCGLLGRGQDLVLTHATASQAGQQRVPPASPAVDPATPPARAPYAGHTAKENRPTQQTFHCQACGHTA
ncbi:hypothetical protein ABZS94_28735 [Streptomyces sp. NPDC005500]|uniref:hypothetical protein n=1 Tax=Streptomyces sp. NPDC005500 TaxID=3155007 RepID=UPI0033A0D612